VEAKEATHGGIFKRHKKDVQELKNKVAALEAENESLRVELALKK
jgi:hypothetical protein